MHLGVQNVHPEKEPQIFDIKIRQVSHHDSLTEDVTSKWKLYDSLFEGTDGHKLSD